MSFFPVKQFLILEDKWTFAHCGASVKKQWELYLESTQERGTIAEEVIYETNPYQVKRYGITDLVNCCRLLLFPRLKGGASLDAYNALFKGDTSEESHTHKKLLKTLCSDYFAIPIGAFYQGTEDSCPSSDFKRIYNGIICFYRPATKALLVGKHHFELLKDCTSPTLETLREEQEKQIFDLYKDADTLTKKFL